MVRPVIALLTDFGTSDPYVGAMKGAILSVCPEAAVVDVLHAVPAHDVAAGALALDAAWPCFPAGTVFAVVVDPGVGTARRAIAVEAGGRAFVAPDNGLLTLVLAAHGDARVHVIENERLFRRPVSPVFHGRDVFGPVAAHLARGMPLEGVGPAVEDAARLGFPSAARRGDGWDAVVLAVDRFGNMVTNLTATELGSLLDERDAIEVVIGESRVPVVLTYDEAPEGALCALVGSSGRLEVAANRARASDRLGAGPGTPVRVRSRS